MANSRNGNTICVDTAGDVCSKPTSIFYVVVTATAANAIVVLSNVSTNEKKLELRVPTSGTSERFDFSRTPIYFPNGVTVSTVTNASVTLVVSS